MKRLLSLLSALALWSIISPGCGKNTTGPADDPQGGNTGYNARDTSVSLENGRITLEIPAGALKAGTAVKTGSSTAAFANPADLLYQFQLLPEGTVFKKPVRLIFHYDNGWLKGNSPFNIGVAFRYDKDGKWYAPVNGEVDTVNHTLSIPITHFSHWSVYTCFHLETQYDDQHSVDNETLIDMPAGKSATLRCYLGAPPPVITKEDVDDGDLALIAPLVTDPVTRGQRLDMTDCRDCNLLAPLVPIDPTKDKGIISPHSWYVNTVLNGNSQVGTITRSGKTATYQAPGQTPAHNPVTVKAGIRTRKYGTIYVVQNIRIGEQRRWKIILTARYTANDPYSIDEITDVTANFFVHCSDRTYNTGDNMARILYLDSVQYDTPISGVTITGTDQFSSYQISYKSPTYQYQPGVIGTYNVEKNTFTIALNLESIKDAQISHYCFAPDRGNYCVTETDYPLMLPPLEAEALSAADGYNLTYADFKQESPNTETIGRLKVVTIK